MALDLTPVRSADEIREAVQKFNDIAVTWSHAPKLLRSTTYWVYDREDELFGPAQVVAFTGIDASSLEAAASGDSDDGPFNGDVTKRGIEQTLGVEFWDDEELSEMLVMWGDELVAGVFEDVDASAWRFVVLPQSFATPGRRAKT